MRAGNADRQAAVDRLTTHFADGRLDANEFDQRVATAYGSTYLDELQPLFVDLPQSRPERPSWSSGPPPLPGPGGDRYRQGGPWGPRGRRHGPPPQIRLALFMLLVLVLIWSVAAVANGIFPFPLIWLVIALMLVGRMRQHRRMRDYRYRR